MSVRRSARLQQKRNQQLEHEQSEEEEEEEEEWEESVEEDNKSEPESDEDGETDLIITEELTQSELEEIVDDNPNLKHLNLEIPYECDTVFNFDNLDFPHLESLKMNCIKIENGIRFQKEQFPKLSVLNIMNVNFERSRGCDFDFNLPELKQISLGHIECYDANKFALSISKCVKLQSFFSYKLIIFGALKKVALLNVESFIMHRAECMTSLSLWAPKLKKLELRSNWELTSVNILSSIPNTFNKDNTAKIPKSKYSKFDVELILCDPKIKAGQNRIKSIERTTVDDWPW